MPAGGCQFAGAWPREHFVERGCVAGRKTLSSPACIASGFCDRCARTARGLAGAPKSFNGCRHCVERNCPHSAAPRPRRECGMPVEPEEEPEVLDDTWATRPPKTVACASIVMQCCSCTKQVNCLPCHYFIKRLSVRSSSRCLVQEGCSLSKVTAIETSGLGLI